MKTHFLKAQLPGAIGFRLFATVAILGGALESAAAPYQRAQPTDNEREEIVVFRRLPSAEQLPALRRLERPKQLRWIQLIRNYDPDRSWTGQRGRQFEELLALNDTETTQWMIRQYENTEDVHYDFIHAIKELHTAEGIAFLASLTISNAPHVIVGDDFPVSFFATRILLNQMLPNIAALPPPVRDWARNSQKNRMDAWERLISAGGNTREVDILASDHMSYREREIAQLWWRASEKAILAGKWQDVQPGEDFDTPKFRAFLAQLTAQRPGVAQNEPPPIASKGKKSDPAPGKPVEAPGDPARRTQHIALALLLVLGVVALLFRTVLKRRIDKTKDTPQNRGGE